MCKFSVWLTRREGRQGRTAHGLRFHREGNSSVGTVTSHCREWGRVKAMGSHLPAFQYTAAVSEFKGWFVWDLHSQRHELASPTHSLPVPNTSSCSILPLRGIHISPPTSYYASSAYLKSFGWEPKENSHECFCLCCCCRKLYAGHLRGEGKTAGHRDAADLSSNTINKQKDHQM